MRTKCDCEPAIDSDCSSGSSLFEKNSAIDQKTAVSSTQGESSSCDEEQADGGCKMVARSPDVSNDDKERSQPSRSHCLRGTGGGNTTEPRQIGVATRFVVVAQPSSTQSKSSRRPTSARPGHGRPSSTSNHRPFSTSSSSGSGSDTSSLSTESLPDGYARVAHYLSQYTSEWDVQRLMANCRQLNYSQFYVAELTSTDAKYLLQSTPPGTFVVRDSAHPRHLYSLTIKTDRGVTSIRTSYDVDGFRLDSDPDQAELMPAFDSVVALVSHYVDEARTAARQRTGRRCRSSCVFVDRMGRKDAPVILRAPFRSRPPCLRHLCRLAINTTLEGRDVGRLCLLPSLRSFLEEHPFIV